MAALALNHLVLITAGTGLVVLTEISVSLMTIIDALVVSITAYVMVCVMLCSDAILSCFV